jgi:opacity protein-like surface antigen
MKKGFLLFLVVFSPFLANAQFDQKVSLKFNAGTFKTFGKKLGQYEPMQMPNYKMGFSANAGVQFKVSTQFSLSAELGIMISQRWSYSEGGNDNYLYWYINDPVTEAVIAEGESYLDIYNYSIGVRPIYYLNEGKKLSFFVYAGVNINSTKAIYEDTRWIKLKELNMLPPDDTGPYNYNLEKNIGLGFNPGLGLEFFPKERIGLNLTTGYYFIMLNKKNFISPEREENFNAVVIQAGLRFYFIKSKDL